MKNLLILITITLLACNSQEKTEPEHSKHDKTSEDKTELLGLNNGNKWKADKNTKEHIKEIVLIINDSIYLKSNSKPQFISKMQNQVDALIKDCKMEGADHDTLHLWLQKVLKDLKEIKEEEDEHAEAYTNLKNSILSFYQFFE